MRTSEELALYYDILSEARKWDLGSSTFSSKVEAELDYRIKHCLDILNNKTEQQLSEAIAQELEKPKKSCHDIAVATYKKTHHRVRVDGRDMWVKNDAEYVAAHPNKLVHPELNLPPVLTNSAVDKAMQEAEMWKQHEAGQDEDTVLEVSAEDATAGDIDEDSMESTDWSAPGCILPYKAPKTSGAYDPNSDASQLKASLARRFH